MTKGCGGNDIGRVIGVPSGGGRVDIDPRVEAIHGGFLTFDDVEARLVEAITLWWRMPGGGKSPYATDGPWELIRAEWGDYYDPDARPRQPPLSRAQIARMQEATEWMRFVPERDRRLVALAVNALAKGASQVPWMALRKPMGVKLGAHGLRKRYARALSLVVQRVNGRTC